MPGPGRVLELRVEIDFLYFMLEEWLRRGPRSPFDAMIDEATGHEAARLAQVKGQLLQLRRLRTKYATLTGEPFDTAEIDKMLTVITKAEGKSGPGHGVPEP